MAATALSMKAQFARPKQQRFLESVLRIWGANRLQVTGTVHLFYPAVAGTEIRNDRHLAPAIF